MVGIEQYSKLKYAKFFKKIVIALIADFMIELADYL